MLDYVEKKIYKYLNDLNINKSNIKVQLGYSGGIDSSCLLDVLLNLKDRLGVSVYLSYVNYNTSNYSKEVLKHIKKLPKTINKNIKTVDISPTDNFESKARDLRYRFFNEISEKNNIDLTFTAHHKKDQLETLIMQFINASDFISMIGIREEIGNLRRPFLKCDKSDILKYVKNNNLKFFKDPTNNNYSFKRNKVRKVILPLVENDRFLFNKITNFNKSSLAKISKLRKKIMVDLASLEKTKIESCVIISYSIIESYDYVEMKLFFQTIFKEIFKSDNYRANRHFWIELKNFIDSSNVGSTFNILKSLVVLKERESLIIYDSIKMGNIDNKRIRVLNETSWGLGKISTIENINRGLNSKFECFVSHSSYKKGVYLRSWEHGDRVELSAGKHKKVSDIFVDAKIPLFKKKIYPILEDSSNEIVWIPGLFDKNRFSQANDKILIKWEE